VAAQSPVAVHLSGFHPAWKSEMSEYSPARARALLELYGWRDRDGDGWRETPEGQPFVLEMATQPAQEMRRFDELMKRDMSAIGLRIVFRTAQWPEQYKAARAGKLMLWSVSGRASAPDGIEGLLRCWSVKTGKVFTGAGGCSSASSRSSSSSPSSVAPSSSLSFHFASSSSSCSLSASASLCSAAPGATAVAFTGEADEGTKGLASAASGDLGGVRRSFPATTSVAEAIEVEGKAKEKLCEPLARRQRT
jgi:ABC-type transport system substrate-binding protein